MIFLYSPIQAGLAVFALQNNMKWLKKTFYFSPNEKNYLLIFTWFLI
jgi:hypothetical protein